jgi:succinylglutamic semialdehyde dehydrogenase
MSLRSTPIVGRGDYIDGEFLSLSDAAPERIEHRSPADLDDLIGEFYVDPARAGLAVERAQRALRGWRRSTFDHRVRLLEAYREALKKRREPIAVAISRAIGKPLWESRTEADALVAKVDISLRAAVEMGPREVEPGAFVRYRPIGVCAVLGPFNFPAHLANGHIVPLLAAANTVVFKPSERAPQVGELMAECFDEAGFDPGVVNVVQGGPSTAKALVNDPRVDGVMFTGSTEVGRSILRASSEFAGRMLALEMGGNNPALVLSDADLDYACREIAFAAFVTAGQRCTAARRVIVHRSVADAVIERLAFAARESVVGLPSSPDSFMGPVISERARSEALELAQGFERRSACAAVVELEPKSVEGARGFYLRPGLYVAKGELGRELGGCEWFAPLAFVEVCDDVDAMIARANDTRFGLAASVFTADSALFRSVSDALDAGVINWNRGTVGSSSKLPFGGVKDSGNHRAAGLHSFLYASDPVAELHVPQPKGGVSAPGLRLP